MFKTPKNYAGFTVIELLIAISIASIIMLVATALYVQSGQTTMIVKDRGTATYAVQEAVERMIDDVRNADAFTEITANSFVIAKGGDKTEYIFNKTNGSIEKNSAVYALGLTDFVITYFNMRGIETTDPAAASRMTLTISVTEKDITKTIDTSVIMRRRTTSK